MLPKIEQKMDEIKPELRKKKERNFALQLNTNQEILDSSRSLNLDSEGSTQPVLVIQSPKTPTLSRKLKAVSLDSDAGQTKNLEVARDVSSVPNTPKKQAKKVQCNDFDNLNDYNQKSTLTPLLGSNLKRFASNTSISGSQTLKTLPEVMTLQDFSGVKTEPIRIKAKGLLERRGSNASLTIDLGSNTNLSEPKAPPVRLNTAKSVSNLNLTSFGCDKCLCQKNIKLDDKNIEQKKSNEKCNHTIYESIPSGSNVKKYHQIKHSESLCKCNLKFLPKYYIERHCVCNIKFRRKSLSNENLYVPPCNFCHFGSKDCYINRGCTRGSRRALYPRQTYIEASQLLSEDFKLHLQNIQYLQTAGSVLSMTDLKSCCQMDKIPRLHQEFWEIPLNLQEKCLVSGSQSRNRYRGVLPNEHSRVHLPGNQPYIHANYVKGPDYTETAYIATQGPMSHTCEDFWNMIWSNKAKQIIMLTGLVEKGRSKCELYFPLGEENKLKEICKTPSNPDSSEDEYIPDLIATDILTFGPYTIRYIGKEILGECTIRTLTLNKIVIDKKQGRNIEHRTLYHYWYPNWADHKLANPEQVLKIALRVLGLENSKNSSTTESTSSDSENLDIKQKFNYDNQSFENQNLVKNNIDLVTYDNKMMEALNLNDDKVFSYDIDNDKSKNKFTFESESKKDDGNLVAVHCSAGIGRTGCFLAILNGIQQLRTNYNVDILAIVCSLRLNRGGMVQTAEQYELIHRVLSLYAEIFSY